MSTTMTNFLNKRKTNHNRLLINHFQFSEDKRHKRSRGCVRAYNQEHACALITALSSDVDGKCDLCSEDKCNSAGAKNLSLLAVVLGIALFYLRT